MVFSNYIFNFDGSYISELPSIIEQLNKYPNDFFSDFKTTIKKEVKEIENTMITMPNDMNVYSENKLFVKSYNDFCLRYGLLNKFNPVCWVFVSVNYDDSGIVKKLIFKDTSINYTYSVCDGYLITIYDGITSTEVNTYIKIPQELWYKIEHKFNCTKSIIGQNSIYNFKESANNVKKSHKVIIKENKKMKVSKDQKELIEFLSSINNKSFDEIYMEIVKYRIKRYNKGLVVDIPFPYNKTTLDISKLQDTLLKNNYEQFPSLKKWVDKVIFLDIDRRKNI